TDNDSYTIRHSATRSIITCPAHRALHGRGDPRRNPREPPDRAHGVHCGEAERDRGRHAPDGVANPAGTGQVSRLPRLVSPATAYARAEGLLPHPTAPRSGPVARRA